MKILIIHKKKNNFNNKSNNTKILLHLKKNIITMMNIFIMHQLFKNNNKIINKFFQLILRLNKIVQLKNLFYKILIKNI